MITDPYDYNEINNSPNFYYHEVPDMNDDAGWEAFSQFLLENMREVEGYVRNKVMSFGFRSDSCPKTVIYAGAFYEMTGGFAYYMTKYLDDGKCTKDEHNAVILSVMYYLRYEAGRAWVAMENKERHSALRLYNINEKANWHIKRINPVLTAASTSAESEKEI